jgi:L-aspartate oxidase
MTSRYLFNFDLSKIKREYVDLVIVGTGIAGLSVALKVCGYLQTVLITKGKLGDSSTFSAQGGIAAALSPEDSPELHLKDTLNAGNGLCDSRAVHILVAEGPRRVKELMQLGVKFDSENEKLDFSREGGHSLSRIVHRGDATGKEIANVLMEKVKLCEGLEVKEFVMAVDILTEKGKCLGVLVLEEETLKAYLSPNVVLATGGAGSIYSATTNPLVATGDGMAMAYRAGAILSDLEFMQFHPTALHDEENPRFLITEALRGAGAYLRDGEGKRFMEGIHPLAELAPRYVVVREMVKVMNRERSDHIFLDARHIPKEKLKKGFPQVYEHCLKMGFDISKDLVPVSPAAHFYIGGVKTDYFGKTSVEGLYACGEVAATGVHGANRLASNSLLEGLVFAHRTAQDILKSSSKREKYSKSLSLSSSSSLNKKSEKNTLSRSELGELMMKKAGIIRNKEGLSEALSALEGSYLPSELCREEIELSNMKILSYLLSYSALRREESRGVHIREDFPEKREIFSKHIWVRRGKDGKPELGFS